jgi:hypothetical protein
MLIADPPGEIGTAAKESRLPRSGLVQSDLSGPIVRDDHRLGPYGRLGDEGNPATHCEPVHTSVMALL